MTPREWFEGVLGWEYHNNGSECHYWQDPKDERRKAYLNPPPILEEQWVWIQYVVKPMREMGYYYEIDPDHYGPATLFAWWDLSGDDPVSSAEIIDDNIFQASLDAAERVPEVRERLEKWRIENG